MTSVCRKSAIVPTVLPLVATAVACAVMAAAGGTFGSVVSAGTNLFRLKTPQLRITPGSCGWWRW